jgi:hypothetical protein
LLLKADHPPPVFFGFVSGFVAAGVGLAQALGQKEIKAWMITAQDRKLISPLEAKQSQSLKEFTFQWNIYVLLREM